MKNELLCLVLVLFFAGFGFGGAVEDMESSSVKGGLVVHIGCGAGTETCKLLVNDRYIVQGLDVSEDNVQEARRNIRGAGIYGKVTAYRFDGKSLPYVDNLVNLIVSNGKCDVSKEEILRVLAPSGVAFVNGEKIVKPWPDDIDEWNHFLNNSDNNAVAKDRTIKAPRSIQWVGPPKWGRSHEELASLSTTVSAKGRVFFIVDEAPLASIRYDGQWKLIARDAFNGKLLWKKSIGNWNDHLRHFRSGPLHLPRRLAAVGDRVYVTLGLDAKVICLDGATGETIRQYDGTENTEEILVDNGILYAVVGSSEVYRTGGGLHMRGEPEATDFRFITAIDAQTGKKLWKAECADNEFLLPVSLTVKGESVYYQSTGGVVRLDAESGKEIWKQPRLTPKLRMSFSGPTIVATDEVLLCADRSAKPDNTAAGEIKWGVHGWNEDGYPRKGKSVLRAYAVKDGEELWSVACGENYNAAVDIFVVGDRVWVGSNYKSYDLKTGKLLKELKWQGDAVGMGHHRCYRNKANEEFIFTGRSGIEMVSLEKGWQGNNSWIRGTCQYGIMPANGLLYAPPDACACFSKVKVSGFFAIAGHRGQDGTMALPEKPVLEKGPAYGKVAASKTSAADWPMHRNNPARSGAVKTTVPDSLSRKWSTILGGKLTQPVSTNGKVFVASSDEHTVYALSEKTGKKIWAYTAGGRIDSSPTLYKGMALFGSADGWVYALDASNGELAWRFRAAANDWQVGVYDQLESVWPVHGTVLVQNNTIYVIAGRSTYLDCGMIMYRLDPVTGAEISKTVVYDIDPVTDAQTGYERKGNADMEGATTDILSGDGSSVFMKHLNFDASGKLTKERKPHLFSITGMLDEEWFVRSYWLVGDDTGSGWGKWARAANISPSGKILSFDDDNVYGYGRIEIAGGPAGHTKNNYHLFACKNITMPYDVPAISNNTQDKNKRRGKDKSPRRKKQPPIWSIKKSPIARAMVLTDDKLIIAGPADIAIKNSEVMEYENEAKALAAYTGQKGALLQLVSTKDGQILSEYELETNPTFDGMMAANGKVFVSLKNGKIQCWGR